MTWRRDSAAVSVWMDKIMCCWWRPEFAVQQLCGLIAFFHYIIPDDLSLFSLLFHEFHPSCGLSGNFIYRHLGCMTFLSYFAFLRKCNDRIICIFMCFFCIIFIKLYIPVHYGLHTQIKYQSNRPRIKQMQFSLPEKT